MIIQIVVTILDSVADAKKGTNSGQRKTKKHWHGFSSMPITSSTGLWKIICFEFITTRAKFQFFDQRMSTIMVVLKEVFYFLTFNMTERLLV